MVLPFLLVADCLWNQVFILPDKRVEKFFVFQSFSMALGHGMPCPYETYYLPDTYRINKVHIFFQRDNY
jgi:hypothetical protein